MLSRVLTGAGIGIVVGLIVPAIGYPLGAVVGAGIAFFTAKED